MKRKSDSGLARASLARRLDAAASRLEDVESGFRVPELASDEEEIGVKGKPKRQGKI